MAIVVKNNKITEEIVNEEGKQIGKIEYDPSDTKTYNELLNIIQETMEIKKKIEEAPEIKTQIKTIEDLEKNKEVFDKILEISNYSTDVISKIIQRLDSIFGAGTCELFLKGTQNLNYVYPLFDNVLPKFKEARKGKVDKYLSEESDVME